MTRRKQPKPRACLTKRKFLFTSLFSTANGTKHDGVFRSASKRFSWDLKYFSFVPKWNSRKIDFIDSKPLFRLEIKVKWSEVEMPEWDCNRTIINSSDAAFCCIAKCESFYEINNRTDDSKRWRFAKISPYAVLDIKDTGLCKILCFSNLRVGCSVSLPTSNDNENWK